MKHARGQGVVRVGDLFSKYREQLKPPQKAVIAAFIEAVKEVTRIPLSPERCSYTTATRTIALRVSGMEKTEIFLNQKKILGSAEKKLGKKFAPKAVV